MDNYNTSLYNVLMGNPNTRANNTIGRYAGSYGQQTSGDSNPLDFFAKKANSAENAIGTTGAVAYDLVKQFNENKDTANLLKQGNRSLDEVYKKYGFQSKQDYYDQIDNAERAGDQERLNSLLNNDAMNAELQSTATVTKNAMDERDRAYDDYRKNNYASQKINQDNGKFLGSAINTLSTGFDILSAATGIPNTPLINGIQGGIEGFADELEQNGGNIDVLNGQAKNWDNFDWNRARQNAAIGALSGAATGAFNTSNLGSRIGTGKLMNNKLANKVLGAIGPNGESTFRRGLATAATRGAASGAIGGAVGSGASSAMNGVELGQGLLNTAQGALQGAKSGAVVGGAMHTINSMPGISNFMRNNQGEWDRWQNSGRNFKERYQNTLWPNGVSAQGEATGFTRVPGAPSGADAVRNAYNGDTNDAKLNNIIDEYRNLAEEAYGDSRNIIASELVDTDNPMSDVLAKSYDQWTDDPARNRQILADNFRNMITTEIGPEALDEFNFDNYLRQSNRTANQQPLTQKYQNRLNAALDNSAEQRLNVDTMNNSGDNNERWWEGSKSGFTKIPGAPEDDLRRRFPGSSFNADDLQSRTPAQDAYARGEGSFSDALNEWLEQGGNIVRNNDGTTRLVTPDETRAREALAQLEQGLRGPVNETGTDLGFDQRWREGNINGVDYEAKVYDTGSQYGIDNGPISKLQLKDSQGRTADYDRGWSRKPRTNAMKDAVKQLQEYYSPVAQASRNPKYQQLVAPAAEQAANDFFSGDWRNRNAYETDPVNNRLVEAMANAGSVDEMNAIARIGGYESAADFADRMGPEMYNINRPNGAAVYGRLAGNDDIVNRATNFHASDEGILGRDKLWREAQEVYYNSPAKLREQLSATDNNYDYRQGELDARAIINKYVKKRDVTDELSHMTTVLDESDKSGRTFKLTDNVYSRKNPKITQQLLNAAADLQTLVKQIDADTSLSNSTKKDLLASIKSVYGQADGALLEGGKWIADDRFTADSTWTKLDISDKTNTEYAKQIRDIANQVYDAYKSRTTKDKEYGWDVVGKRIQPSEATEVYDALNGNQTSANKALNTQRDYINRANQITADIESQIGGKLARPVNQLDLANTDPIIFLKGADGNEYQYDKTSGQVTMTDVRTGDQVAPTQAAVDYRRAQDYISGTRMADEASANGRANLESMSKTDLQDILRDFDIPDSDFKGMSKRDLVEMVEEIMPFGAEAFAGGDGRVDGEAYVRSLTADSLREFMINEEGYSPDRVPKSKKAMLNRLERDFVLPDLFGVSYKPKAKYQQEYLVEGQDGYQESGASNQSSKFKQGYVKLPGAPNRVFATAGGGEMPADGFTSDASRNYTVIKGGAPDGGDLVKADYPLPANASKQTITQEIRRAIADRFQGNSYKIGDTGKEAKVNAKTKNEMSYQQPNMNDSDFNKKGTMVGNLDELLENMRGARRVENKKPNQKPTVDYYISGRVPVELGNGDVYYPRVDVEVSGGKAVAYNIADIKRYPGAMSQGTSFSGDQPAVDNLGTYGRETIVPSNSNNVNTEETEVYRNLTGQGGEPIDLNGSFKQDIEPIKNRNILQSVGKKWQNEAKVQRYSGILDSLDAKTAERAVKTNAPQKLAELGIKSPDYTEAAKFSTYVNRVVSDLAKNSKVKVNVPDLVDRLNPQNLDVQLSDASLRTYNNYLSKLNADGDSPSQYTAGNLLEFSRWLGDKAANLRGGADAKDTRQALTQAKYIVRDIVADALDEAGVTGDLTTDNIVKGLANIGANEKVQDYFAEAVDGKAPTVTDLIHRSALFEQARDMGTQIEAEKYTRSASKKPTNPLTRIYEASGIDRLVEPILKSTVAPAASKLTDLAGKTLEGVGNAVAGVGGGNGNKPTQTVSGEVVNNGSTTFPYNAIGRYEGIEEAETVPVPNTNSDESLETYNALTGNTAGSTSGNTTARTAGYLETAQNSTSPFTSDEEERQTYFFRPTGDQWQDMLSRAMRRAHTAGDWDAFGQLYEMYRDSSSSSSSSSSTSSLNASQQAQLAKLDAAGSAIDELEALFDQAGGGKGPILGNLQSIGGDWGLDSNARTYNQLSEGLVNQIAQAIGKTDSLNTEGEVKRALQLIPQLTDDATTAKNKLETLRRMLSTTRSSYQSAYGLNS